jgi:peroxiredoxin
MTSVMKSFLISCLLAAAALGATPKVGDDAPPFSLTASDGSTVALKDYAGKSKVVLVFYRGYW